ncbi:hypothetical protein ACP70R_003288 [Stipagrostis hirtigluma subsp. patula]
MTSPAPLTPSPTTTRVESRCIPRISRGTISFDVTGYQLIRDLRIVLSSSSINVGGYDWRLRCYPDGDIRENTRGFIGIFLELLTKNVEVTVVYALRLVSQATGSSLLLFSGNLPTVFNTIDESKMQNAWGQSRHKSMKKTELEATEYLHDDHLVIECDITVVKEAVVVETARTNAIEAVPMPNCPNLSQDLAKLLEAKDGANVTFEVQGEVVTAHTIVLATRSPVFKAQFYGPMSQQNGHRKVKVEDMEASVFKALLHFIYTDSLFCMDGLDKVEKNELTKHLLVAADQYDVQGLKFLCEKTLCESLDVETVASTLVFADRYSCGELKRACVEFITCSDRLEDVVASDGYGLAKANCPALLVDVLEKAAMLRKI